MAEHEFAGVGNANGELTQAFVPESAWRPIKTSTRLTQLPYAPAVAARGAKLYSDATSIAPQSMTVKLRTKDSHRS